jgi:hypothetical protein
VLRRLVQTIVPISLLVVASRAYCKPVTLGWQELVRVLPGEPIIEASLDTIDESGSLHVESYRRVVKTTIPAEGAQPVNVTPINHPLRTPTVTATQSPYPSQHPKNNLNRRVRFNLTDRFGHSHDYELPVLRSIKVKSTGGKTEIRPVVPLTICIGNLTIDGEFSLRRGLDETNHIRIGRRDLAGKGLVDPSKSFTLQPSCR